MKSIVLLSLVFFLCTAEKCGSEKPDITQGIYKGKLEVKGICMNYTISALSPIDTSMVVADWTDESTGKSYKNAFGLGNPCHFPASLKAGDEFRFAIDTSKQEDCIVCMAYYPTPSKKLSIKILPD